jgi:hypothetical protein
MAVTALGSARFPQRVAQKPTSLLIDPMHFLSSAVPHIHHSLRNVTFAGLALLLSACSTRDTLTGPPERPPEAVRADVVRLLPAATTDKPGWADVFQTAFSIQGIEPSTENICAVIAVTEQESTFQADPPVPGLAKIARAEIDRRAGALHVPAFLVDAALRIPSPDGRSYADRLAKVRTEGELSAIFEDLIGLVPLGQKLFGGLNPVRTGGPMQVSIAFAEADSRGYPYEIEGSLRREVFGREGGMYFGIAHLLGYPANYDRPLYRFADFNAGWYASRNAAFQAALSAATGVKLALDGDLIIHGSSRAGQTEMAARRLGPRLNMSEAEIRRALERGTGEDFERTDLYEAVFALARNRTSKVFPAAVLPGIRLESPKITRNLTTAWFADRVDARWKRCMSRAAAR